MAELVDASDSKSGFSNGVQVRFLFWAQARPRKDLYLSYYGVFTFHALPKVQAVQFALFSMAAIRQEQIYPPYSPRTQQKNTYNKSI